MRKGAPSGDLINPPSTLVLGSLLRLLSEGSVGGRPLHNTR